MQILSSPSEVRSLRLQCGNGSKVVLVPTMGALHVGHKSLLDQARQLAGPSGLVVASIFLNPIQFNNASDLTNYPQTPQDDLAMCEQAGVDVVFFPRSEDMYASDRSISIEETALSRFLCGASRPGHFAGVCTVVAKLFNIVQPTDAIFGKKDFQQLAILKRMVRDLNFPIDIHGAEIVRESDGLAFSSRNVRLTATQRAEAPVLCRVLQRAKARFEDKIPLADIRAEAEEAICSCSGTVIDYLEIVDPENLEPVSDQSEYPMCAVMALAVYFGEVRLIDNIEL